MRQIKEDFELTAAETYESISRALNRRGFTHTHLKPEMRPMALDLLFNPWTMEILKGPYKGSVIEAINGFAYKDFFVTVKDYIPPSCASMYHIKFVRWILQYTKPCVNSVTLRGIGDIHTLPTTGSLKGPAEEAWPNGNGIQDNCVYIHNFAQDLSSLRAALEQVRDDYDEWTIMLGGGGHREEAAKILIAFFDPEDLSEELANSRIRRTHTKWASSQVSETDTNFRQYAFQGLRARLPTFKGTIKIMIGSGVGSASYVFAVFMLLMGGKWKIIDNTYVLSKKSSQVQLIARNYYNRVSNRFNGEDGGHLTPSGLKRPNLLWENPQRHLVGYFLVGRI